MVRRITAVVLVIAVSGVVLGAPPAFGDHSPTNVYPESDTYEVEPGGTVAVGVMMSSDGGFLEYDNGTVEEVGITGFELVVEYDGELLEPNDVEIGSWLDVGDRGEIESSTKRDDDATRVTVSQERTAADTGVLPEAGFDRLATVSFDVAPDAAGETTVRFVETTVDSPDESLEPNVQSATISVTSGEDTAGGDTADDSGPGFTVVAGFVALLGAVFVGIGRRRRDRTRAESVGQ